jgi:hypothetical protein
MMPQGSDSPEHAAMEGFPAKWCRVLARRVHGDDAYVLLDTGSRDRPYLYGVTCKRQDGRWIEGASGNGPGWSQTDEATRLGTWSMWDEAPAGVEMVRVELNGQVLEERVVDGAYLAVWFRQPEPRGPGPRVTAYRIAGRWIDQR